MNKMLERLASIFGSLSFFKKIALVAAASIVTVALVLMVVFSAVSAANEREHERIQELAKPLELERTLLEAEIADLTRKISDMAKSGATLATVILDINEGVYTSIYPIFEGVNERMAKEIAIQNGEYDEDASEEESRALKEKLELHRAAATVCLSLRELPDMEGNVTEEQLQEMLDSGWSTAIYVNAADAARLDSYLSDMEAAYDRLGIERTDTLCFSIGVYTTAMDSILASHGISCVITTVHEGENILSRDLESDVWCVKADGWSGRSGSAVAAYNDLLSSHGASAFLISTIDGYHRYDAADFRVGVDDSSLERMLDLFSDDIVKGDMYVDSAMSARERYAIYLADCEYYESYYRPPLEAAEARLAEVNVKLHELYYGSGKEEE